MEVPIAILAALILINFLLLRYSCQKCDGKKLKAEELKKFSNLGARDYKPNK